MASYIPQSRHQKLRIWPLFKTGFLSKYSFLSVALLLVCFGLSCGGSKPAQFYTLSTAAVENSKSAEMVGTDITVGVGPIKFPDYLLRPQIAIHTSRNELSYAEFNRWAEPLDENFTRVLTENLSREIPTDKIVHFPWRASSLVQYQVVIEVVQFVQKADNQIHLLARWHVLTHHDGSNTEIRFGKKSVLSHAAPAMVKEKPDYDAVVAIMSDLVADLSTEIAEGVKNSLTN